MDRLEAYEILGISYGADEKIVHAAYRRLAKFWHPDHNKSPQASEEFDRAVKAYKCIINGDDTKYYVGPVDNRSRLRVYWDGMAEAWKWIVWRYDLDIKWIKTKRFLTNKLGKKAQ